MLRVAVVQMQPVLLDPPHNRGLIEGWLARAADAGAGLAVFPECVVPGYFLSRSEAEAEAEPIPGPTSERLQAACSRTGLTAAVGLIERGPGALLYNAALLVGPDGLLGVYRKTHLLCLGVDRYLTRGPELLPVVSAPAARVGLLICYDLRFPEPMRALALDGAQVVLLPTAWPSSATFYPDYLARARAVENGVFLIAADRVGEERGRRFLGRSLILAPDGEVLAEGPNEGEAMLVADLDLTQSDAKRRVFEPGEYEVDLLRDRRPELYGRLTRP